MTILKLLAFYGRFLFSFTAVGFRVRALFWGKAAPDFSGQTWLVTGASGGVGKAIVLAAARGGATVIAAARDPAKLERLIAETAGCVEAAVVDLSLMADTERFARDLAARGRQLDVLVNNVGILNTNLKLTREGREISLATNILSHFLLTERLVASNMFATKATVVNMASGGMYHVPLTISRMNVTDAKTYDGILAYAFHKRGQVELTQYWQETYGARGLRFYAMHPGWVDTDGLQQSLPGFHKILRVMLRTPEQGADTAIWLAAERPTSPPGAIWFDRKPRTSHIFSDTRRTTDTPAALASELRREIERA